MHGCVFHVGLEVNQMRFKFIPPFKAVDLPPGVQPAHLQSLNELEAQGFLKDVEWDLDDGIPAPGVENREELAFIVPGILKLVREACESGKYDAIIIIGGLDPGLYAAKEIGAEFNIPVVGFTSSEIAFACLLGNKYSIIEALDGTALIVRQNVMSYGMNEKCASVRSIGCLIETELKRKPPEAVDKFVRACIEAIEQDGADVIVIGCTVLTWIQPIAQERLNEMEYNVPVLHPFKCAIEMAKALLNMNVTQSKYAFPGKTTREKCIPR
jgi:allantoin racemase